MQVPRKIETLELQDASDSAEFSAFQATKSSHSTAPKVAPQGGTPRWTPSGSHQDSTVVDQLSRSANCRKKQLSGVILPSGYVNIAIENGPLIVDLC